MFPLVPLAPEAGAAADGALRGRRLVRQLQHADVAAIADPVLSGLDDSGVATRTIGELGGDLAEELLDHALARELLLLVDEPAIVQGGYDAAARRQRAR